MMFPTVLFYYEQQIKRELKEIHVCGCRCYERLKAKTDGCTRLAYTVTVKVTSRLFSGEQKREKTEGKKCHTKTMMSKVR